ncbi:B-cell receptor CD22-like isoform X2 [Ranitomeya variabilis]|uniref:B-cell receptor CD22-like isoform X2 n=1 Tax=Ranitomeya variabilis TaxID=490064 RepID=UPI0040579E28
MDPMKQIYLLLICHGFYLGSVCQPWMASQRIFALNGSCVEIPCTYDPAESSGAPGIVWYLNCRRGDQEILNTQNSTLVMKEYKGRTSLVSGYNSCTLRIDPVREEDENIYCPAIIEQKYYINNMRSRYVFLQVTDRASMYFFRSDPMIEGEATIIECTVVHACQSSPPSLQWNKPGQVQYQSVLLSGGTWREESRLTYIPSHMDDGTPVRCTAAHANGQQTERSATLNINYAAIGVNITMKSEEGFTKLICVFQSSRPNVTHYTWMKGSSTLKNETGKTLTVDNNEENLGQYSCIAHNSVGNSSSKVNKDEGSRNSFINSYGHIILPATIGAIGLLLLGLLVYTFWRKKQKRQTTACKTESTYTDLKRSEITEMYSHLKTESTYTDLKRSETTEMYSQLKPVLPGDTTVVQSTNASEYENVHRKNI